MLRLLVALSLILSAFCKAGEWVTDFQRGVELAKKEGKDMLIYFYGEHCPYCWQMEEFVLGDPEVDRFISERFVVVSLDAGKEKELDKKFNVFGTPYFVIYDPKSDRIVFRLFGSRERDDFLSLLMKACNKSSLRRC